MLRLGKSKANLEELVILGNRQGAVFWTAGREGTAAGVGGAEGPGSHMRGNDSVTQGE